MKLPSIGFSARSLMVVLICALVLSGCTKDQSAERAAVENIIEEVTYHTPKSTVDKIYRSMEGPFHLDFVAMDPNDKGLIWITGFKNTMIEGDSEKPLPQEYNCHTDVQLPKRNDPTAKARRDVLFTLSQGQSEIRFPDGFGVPVGIDEPMSIGAQVLNLNSVPEEPFDVRHQVEFQFVRDGKAPMKPLMPAQIIGYKALGEDGSCYYDLKNPIVEEHGAGCLRGETVSQRNVVKDQLGNEFTSHWYVEPGREENSTLVTGHLGLEYDTTIHYISAHLHPFAEYAELRDLTTGETLFRSEVKQMDGKLGLDHVSHYSSEEGIPVYKDHQYQLVSVYQNDTEEPQDAMVVFYIYLLDKKFSPQESNTLEVFE